MLDLTAAEVLVPDFGLSFALSTLTDVGEHLSPLPLLLYFCQHIVLVALQYLEARLERLELPGIVHFEALSSYQTIVSSHVSLYMREVLLVNRVA